MKELVKERGEKPVIVSLKEGGALNAVKHADRAIMFSNRVLTGSFDENHFIIAMRTGVNPNRWRSYRELGNEDNKYRRILKNLAMKVEGHTGRGRMRTRQKRVSLWEEDHGEVRLQDKVHGDLSLNEKWFS